MPSRRRPKSATAQPVSPQPPISPGLRPAAQSNVEHDLERFAAALAESTRLERAAEQQRQHERKAAAAAAEAAAEQERSLAAARRELEAAVAAVRSAKQSGRGRAEADDRWRAAKARVIELETGAPPAWAKSPESRVMDDDTSRDRVPLDDEPVA